MVLDRTGKIFHEAVRITEEIGCRPNAVEQLGVKS